MEILYKSMGVSGYLFIACGYPRTSNGYACMDSWWGFGGGQGDRAPFEGKPFTIAFIMFVQSVLAPEDSSSNEDCSPFNVVDLRKIRLRFSAN